MEQSGIAPLGLALGAYGRQVDEALDALAGADAVARLWDGDHTLWAPEPAEVADRLGWLWSPEVMTEALEALAAFAATAEEDGLTHALLLGMGGSSLAPEMFARTLADGGLDLAVLDSTAPAAVRAAGRRAPLERTLFIVATKSGTTVETLSFFKHFYGRASEVLGAPRARRHFVAITDPGSRLDALARELGLRHAFLNDPEIGGRYSALSFFGLAPAALVGVDVPLLLDRAEAMAAACQAGAPADNPGVQLGAVLGALAAAGRDKLTLVPSAAIAPFGDWLEQLIAESTGKEGRGIVPVVGEPAGAPRAYGGDRFFVHLRLAGDDRHDAAMAALGAAGHPVARIDLGDAYDLGGEIFRWEMATAVAGRVLGVNPFDQPDVESAKRRAREMVESYRAEGRLPAPAPDLEDGVAAVFGAPAGARDAAGALAAFLDQAERGDYVALHAYLAPGEAVDAALGALRGRIRDARQLATTAGYGPRFLHSTGQLHKGDDGSGLFVQLTAAAGEDVSIPDAPGDHDGDLSFGVLIAAQALGDGRALAEAGRRVIRFHLKGDAARALERLAAGSAG